MKRIKNKKGKEGIKNNKLGEITTSQIVMIVLLVVGFAIIIFFIIQLAWSGQVNEQVCHESVVLRGTLPSVTQGYIPLKCMTDKVCITSSAFGKCEAFKDVKGVTKAKISSDKDKARKDIERAITQEIYNCWTMMGEGKLSLFSQTLAETYGIGTVYPTCVLCSRIAFDTASLEKTGADLSRIDILNYMMSHKVPGKDVSYYSYMEGTSPAKISVKDSISLPILNITQEDGKESITQFNEDVLLESYGEGLVFEEEQTGILERPGGATHFVQVDSEITYYKEESGEASKWYSEVENWMPTLLPDEAREIAELTIKATGAKTQKQEELGVLFMQISSPQQGQAAINVGKTVLGVAVGSFLTAPTATIKAGQMAGKACTKGGIWGPIICGAILAAAGIYQQANVARNRAITAGYCGDVSIGTDARNGCSVVRTINYRADDISDYCSVIESIP